MPSRPELHRGRLAKHPRVRSVRALTRDDLARLQGPRVGPPRVKAFRETHHRLARLVAMGSRDVEITRITGYSQQRLVTLRQDPAFQQLVAEYRGRVDEAYERQFDQFYGKAVELKLRGLAMIEDHFDAAEDSGELIPLKQLAPLVADLADRTGHGKHSSQTTEVLNFAELMDQMAKAKGQSNVIDATANEVPQPAAVGFRRR